MDIGARAVSAAWADVLDAATDVDLRRTDGDTARPRRPHPHPRWAQGRRRADELRQLAGWVELLRYRGSVDDVPSVAELRQLADGIRAELMGAISPRDRRRATWWPTSGRLALPTGWNGAAEGMAVWWQRVASKAGGYCSPSRRRSQRSSIRVMNPERWALLRGCWVVGRGRRLTALPTGAGPPAAAEHDEESHDSDAATTARRRRRRGRQGQRRHRARRAAAGGASGVNDRFRAASRPTSGRRRRADAPSARAGAARAQRAAWPPPRWCSRSAPG